MENKKNVKVNTKQASEKIVENMPTLKKLTKVSDQECANIINGLGILYNDINVALFGGKLPQVVIVLESHPKYHGHASVKKVWNTSEGQKYELCLSTEGLNREPIEIMTTLTHEMCHISNNEKGIKDTAQGGRHNKKFQEECARIGLVATKDNKIGWVTNAQEQNEDFKKLTQRIAFEKLTIYREIVKKEIKTKAKSHYIKYQCSCGKSFNATSIIKAKCMECESMFEPVEKEEEN